MRDKTIYRLCYKWRFNRQVNRLRPAYLNYVAYGDGII